MATIIMQLREMIKKTMALNAEIPLIDFGIACLSGVEAVVIRQSPKR